MHRVLELGKGFFRKKREKRVLSTARIKFLAGYPNEETNEKKKGKKRVGEIQKKKTVKGSHEGKNSAPRSHMEPDEKRL